MSHTSAIKAVKITSISALTSAVAELASKGVRCSLLQNAVPRAYFPDQAGMGKAEYVLHLPDAKYDVGLYLQPDKSYEPRTDFYGGSVEAVLGVAATSEATREQAKLGKLLQMYAIHAATETARRKGLSVNRTTGKDGTIRLELTGANL